LALARSTALRWTVPKLRNGLSEPNRELPGTVQTVDLSGNPTYQDIAESLSTQERTTFDSAASVHLHIVGQQRHGHSQALSSV
jgi:hypothetical protein